MGVCVKMMNSSLWRFVYKQTVPALTVFGLVEEFILARGKSTPQRWAAIG